MKHLYLDTPGGPMAATYHAPSVTPTGVAVLMVPPFGWEDQVAFRPRRTWAIALADAGNATLRIDLPGTGDSAGGPHDPGLFDHWISGVVVGLDALRATGAGRVGAIGMGMGGLVTLAAMARGAVVDDLVLWGCPRTGRSALRELKAFARLELSQTGADPATVPPGEIHAGGHVLSAETAGAVGAVDAVALLGTARPARALVLGQDGRDPDADLVQALRETTADVETDPGRGWGDAVVDELSRPPVAVIRRVNAWLGKTAVGTISRPLEGADSAIFGPDGHRCRETPVTFTNSGQRLFGVLSEPVDVPVGGGTVILFNAGLLRHIGPNRMHTECARRWASEGLPVLRLDIPGVGEAGGDASTYTDPDVGHGQALIDHTHSSLRFASERGLPDRFLIGGMCAGAYFAFQVMLADERVAAAVTLNQRVLMYDRDDAHGAELRRFVRILTPRGFRNMLIGHSRRQRLWRLAKWTAGLPLRLGGRLLGRNTTQAVPLDAALESLRERGQRLHLAFSDVEPLHDWLRMHWSLSELERHGVSVYELPNLSHTLKPVESQRAAHAVLDSVVERTFSPERTSAYASLPGSVGS